MSRWRRAAREGAIVAAMMMAIGTVAWWVAIRRHPHPPTPAEFFGGLALIAAPAGLLLALAVGLIERR